MVRRGGVLNCHGGNLSHYGGNLDDFLFAYPASRHPSIRISTQSGAAGSRTLSLWRRARAASLMGGCLEAG
jgi:hypothetical protein